MIRIGRSWFRVVLGGLLAIAFHGCRADEVSVAELFALRSQGLVYLQRGQLPEAQEQFERLVDLAPDDPFGHANLGLTHLRAGSFDEAEESLSRARRLDPVNVEIVLMLAKLYSLTDRSDESRALLEELRSETGSDPRLSYALAELDAGASDSVGASRYEERLREVLAVAPANLAVRLQLAEALLRRGEADSVIRHLEEVRRIPPEPPEDAISLLAESLRLLRAGDLAEATPTVERLHQVMELTAPYQESLYDLGWIEGPLVGRPVLTFAPEDVTTMRALREGPAAQAVGFTDMSIEAGLLPAPPPAAATSPQPAPAYAPSALAMGDIDGDGSDDLFVASGAPDPAAPAAQLYRVVRGQLLDVTERSGITLPTGAIHATFADYDNDGWLDLFAIDGEGRGHLFRNEGNLTFRDVTTSAGLADAAGAQKARFVDLDHDGDLDVLLVGDDGRTVYRNNLDGTFTDATANLGLAGDGARDARFGDFDGDGRIDLVFSGSDGVSLLHNEGARSFRDVTAASGLTSEGGSGAAAVADFDNDGLLDLFVGSAPDGAAALWLGRADGSFARDHRSDEVLVRPGAGTALVAELLDYDNDGWVDLLVVSGSDTPEGTGVRLLHNEGDGTFADRSEVLPQTVSPASAIAASDADEDGDQDLFVAGPMGVARLIRNDGGNLNRAMNVQLKALRTGSGKNNVFGVGARVEVRAGEIHQTRVVTDAVTHFGLGPHFKADVVRVEWPNGVPQSVYLPGSDQDILEAEQLKGSCAFLYTWDGEGFRFVTDVMWRSALGMPLGLMGRGTAFAPAAASREYLRIPGDALRPRDGRYVIQLTEELWETAYLDEVHLLAVDHPDSVDIFVDERFVPPAPVELRLFQSARPRQPLSATDDRGNDLLPALRERDDMYVSNLTPLRYQGLVEPHDLILELDDDAGRAGTFLYLRGWIYPTDASINVALSQQTEVKSIAPSLEVRDANGQWTTVVPFLSFPSGKDKTMVIDLAGIFPTGDHHVRIRTNLQIYWDQAFISSDAASSPVRVTTLAPISSELHFRGFSRTYRKGGRYGPHWFAYDDVIEQSPWRPIVGAFTRFGDVLPLLDEQDDMYVVMGPGDETTVQFDASSADDLPPGWTRDFLLYTDGWIKDSDLNTAYGDSVGPLPFHGIQEYPYAPGESYPADAEHERYLREYNTRVTTRR